MVFHRFPEISSSQFLTKCGGFRNFIIIIIIIIIITITTTTTTTTTE
jgi:hypothetical protein